MTRVVEVRIQGHLGEAVLRLLGWSHVNVPEQTVVRLDVTPVGLQRVLLACTERGLDIERVHRLGGPAGSPPPV